MLFTTKIKWFTFILVLTLSINVTKSAVAQGSYAGLEDKVTTENLLSKAKSADFSNGISAKVFSDSKNSYFAVDLSNLSSDFIKIRILEQSYDNLILVNISSDISKEYYLYLVNNSLDKSDDEVNILFTDFLTQAKNERQLMNDEQMRLWIIQHDKYTKK